MRRPKIPPPRLGSSEWLVLLAGGVFPFSFSPYHLWPLAFVCLGILFWSWRDAGRASATWRGFLFGLGAFAAGVHWVYVSLSTFGGMPPPVAVVMVIGFVIWLSLFTALAGLIQALIGARVSHPWARAWHALATVPASWVLCEWLRGFGSLGFSWLSVGYSQTDSPLTGFAPIAGNFAVSLAVGVCAAGALVLFSTRQLGPRIAAGVVVVLTVVSGYLLGQLTFVQNAGPTLQVAAVQGNIPLTEKWTLGAPDKMLAHYQKLTEGVAHADIVVWPESALPEFIDRIDEAVWRTLEDDGPDYVIGVLERRFIGKQLLYHNAVVSLGDERSTYRKQHLVPFGEYLPLRPIFAWVLDYLKIPMSDFIAWQGHQDLPILGGYPVGVSVCYEDAFARDILPALPQAALLVNVSEDAWFGDSLGPHQRLQMARMRAIETARPMVRASNTGVTAAIERDGRIMQRLEQFQAGVLTATVQPVTGSTPFVRYGNALAVTLLLGLMLAGIAIRALTVTR